VTVPSDLGTGSVEEIEEERRLLYVAMTRARDDLALVQPRRFFVRGQSVGGDRHIYAPRSRFLEDGDLELFDVLSPVLAPLGAASGASAGARAMPGANRVDLKAAMKQMWGR